MSDNSQQEQKDIKSLTEHMIDDPILLQEYKDLHKPFKTRAKFTIYYNTLLFFGLFYYSKNAKFYGDKFYPNRRKGLKNLILISLIHCFIFSSILFAGNCLIIGVNPFTWWKRYKELDRKLIEKDPYKDLTWKEFMEKIKDFQEQQKLLYEKKVENKNI